MKPLHINNRVSLNLNEVGNGIMKMNRGNFNEK
jgi:hypothetical protein